MMKRVLALLLALLLLIGSGGPLPFAAAETRGEAETDAETDEEAEEAPEEAEPEGPEEDGIVVRFVDPTGTVERRVDFGETLVLEPGPEIEGYTFLGWQDAWGNWEARESLRVWESAAYYAVYAMALGGEDEHTPYLPLDSEGAFRPSETMTRRDAVRLIYRLLNTELVGDGTFLDVRRGDACYKATATLKSLGALSGSRFYPDDTITRRELLEILSHFYPICREPVSFSDLSETDPSYPAFALAAARGWIDEGEARPDEELTRLEAAHIFNIIQGRSGDSERRIELVGTLPDVSMHDPWYWDAAEAAIPHDYEIEEDGERWLTSEGFPLRKEGLYYDGVILHAVDSSGSAVIDDWYNNVYFNARGEASSGMPELDERIHAVLAEQVDPATMSQLQMLQNLYFYTVFNFYYSRVNMHEFGETGWEAQEAYDMLRTNRGNCYGFAALFGCLARAIGCDVTVYSGEVIGSGEVALTPHAWVEINFDGDIRLFDPEMEMASAFEGYLRFFNQELDPIYEIFRYRHA